MVIREDQIEALRKAPLLVFEDEMIEHLAAFSPPLFQAVKEAQMREVIRFGMREAAQYGITFRGPVRLYLELMLLFGSRFVTDPQYPWTAQILSDPSEPQMERAERLYQKTLDYRKEVGGPEDAYTINALRRIRQISDRPLPVSQENFSSEMFQAIRAVYPQKVSYLGESGVKALIGEGQAAARQHAFADVRATVLPVVLMFAFGHGCLNDPLYPWISKTLTDQGIRGPEARAKRLERRALTWLDYVLRYFGEGQA